MRKLGFAACATVLLGASATASAWWGGPGYGWIDNWWNDFFGDAWFDFNLNISARGHGSGRTYNHWNNWYGYGPYGWGGPIGWGGYPHYGGAHPYTYPYAAPRAPAITSESK